ncbi:MAG TPA: thioredoxin domain-containing protein [Terrimesophilobacter sp.]|nr:thioredoxin domain-containing protein [Terrimesophilobacter sp.]HRQ00603.1 thioredoxin domain-containing protein [Terrimesophilobacter sp.]
MSKRGRRAQRGPEDHRRAVDPVRHDERRAHAREKARTLREESRKKERRNRTLIYGGLTLIVLLGVTAVVFVLLTAPRPSKDGPANMLSDGIKIGVNFEAQQTPGLGPSETPVPSTPNADDVLDIRIWVDYLCPLCGGFEKANEPYLKSLLNEGAATIEIHPVAILDRLSAGTQYSTRAANAAACVANYSPNEFFSFNSLMLEHQPAPEGPGLGDAAMIEIARTAGVEKASRIATCIENQEFKIWVEQATKRSQTQPVPGTDLDKIPGTPTIIVNGQVYNYTLDEDSREFKPLEFQAFVNDVLGLQFSKSVQPSPSTTLP